MVETIISLFGSFRCLNSDSVQAAIYALRVPLGRRQLQEVLTSSLSLLGSKPRCWLGATGPCQLTGSALRTDLKPEG
jgi:hypothetical protein